MGIFDAWKNRQRKAFVERAEGLAGSIQMEIAKHAYGMLVDRHGDERAYEIAAGITNYVCRFGYVNPQNSNDKDLLTLCDTERSGVLRSFEGTFKTQSETKLGGLILNFLDPTIAVTFWNADPRSVAIGVPIESL